MALAAQLPQKVSRVTISSSDTLTGLAWKVLYHLILIHLE